MQSEADIAKFNKILRNHSHRRAEAALCERSAQDLIGKIISQVEANPEAVAEFLGVPILKDGDGHVMRDKYNRVTGYYDGMFPVVDPNFTNRIGNELSRRLRNCTNSR
jgi:hypothetical protein